MQKVKFLVVSQGKKDAFTDILKQANISFTKIKLEQFSAIDLNQFYGIFFMPGYFEWGKDLSRKEVILKKIKRFVDRGGKLYAESLLSNC